MRHPGSVGFCQGIVPGSPRTAPWLKQPTYPGWMEVPRNLKWQVAGLYIFVRTHMCVPPPPVFETPARALRSALGVQPSQSRAFR